MASDLLTEFRSPTSIVGYIIAVVSIIVGVAISAYFYAKSLRSGRILMSVEQTQVFYRRPIGSFPLRVIGSDGNPITNNIFLADVKIWNSGNAEIKKEDVRKPLKLLIASGLKPIDMDTMFPNDNIDKFSIDRDGVIDWVHFDPNEGLKMRILYESAERLPITLTGKIENVDDISISTAHEPDRSELLLLSFALGLTAAGGIFFASTRQTLGSKVAFASSVAILLLQVGVVAYSQLLGRLTEPPF